MPHSILFVCLGNICRSPLAEGMFQFHAEKAGQSMRFDSAGTASYHIGKPADPRAIAAAKEFGFDISKHRARQLQVDDYRNFDRVLVMDFSNLAAAREIAPARSTVSPELLMPLLGGIAEEALEVPDPYYGDASDFYSVVEMLDKVAAQWVLSIDKMSS